MTSTVDPIDPSQSPNSLRKQLRELRDTKQAQFIEIVAHHRAKVEEIQKKHESELVKCRRQNETLKKQNHELCETNKMLEQKIRHVSDNHTRLYALYAQTSRKNQQYAATVSEQQQMQREWAKLQTRYEQEKVRADHWEQRSRQLSQKLCSLRRSYITATGAIDQAVAARHRQLIDAIRDTENRIVNEL